MIITETFEIWVNGELVIEEILSLDQANELAIEKKLQGRAGKENYVIVKEREAEFYNVSVYEECQAFGGHEEGGWYYTCAEPTGEQFFFQTEQEAEKFAKHLNAKFIGVKSEYHMGYGEHDGVDENGDGDDDYLMAGGKWGHGSYRAFVNNGYEAPCYPKEIPTYS